ncbi:MAG: hypothetical protein ACRC9G_16185, partial [Aeromonas veronii]
MKIDAETYQKLPEHLKALFQTVQNLSRHEVRAAFPESSVTGNRTARSQSATVAGTAWLSDNHKSQEYTDSGSTARFFYCA